VRIASAFKFNRNISAGLFWKRKKGKAPRKHHSAKYLKKVQTRRVKRVLDAKNNWRTKSEDKWGLEERKIAIAVRAEGRFNMWADGETLQGNQWQEIAGGSKVVHVPSEGGEE